MYTHTCRGIYIIDTSNVQIMTNNTPKGSKATISIMMTYSEVLNSESVANCQAFEDYTTDSRENKRNGLTSSIGLYKVHTFYKCRSEIFARDQYTELCLTLYRGINQIRSDWEGPYIWSELFLASSLSCGFWHVSMGLWWVADVGAVRAICEGGEAKVYFSKGSVIY